MEINITKIVKASDELHRFSNSIARSGLQDIGRITWENAVEATDYHLLTTPEQITEAIDWFEGFGAWDREELEAHSDAETNALLLQFIAGDLQEMDMYDTYEEYEQAAEEGQVSGRHFKTEDGQWYFYVGE